MSMVLCLDSKLIASPIVVFHRREYLLVLVGLQGDSSCADFEGDVGMNEQVSDCILEDTTESEVNGDPRRSHFSSADTGSRDDATVDEGKIQGGNAEVCPSPPHTTSPDFCLWAMPLEFVDAAAGGGRGDEHRCGRR